MSSARVLRMRMALEDLRLDEKEKEIELLFWSTTIRVDVLGTTEVMVPREGGEFDVALPITNTTHANQRVHTCKRHR